MKDAHAPFIYKEIAPFCAGPGDEANDGAAAALPRIHRHAALGDRYAYIRIYRYVSISPFPPSSSPLLPPAYFSLSLSLSMCVCVCIYIALSSLQVLDNSSFRLQSFF